MDARFDFRIEVTCTTFLRRQKTEQVIIYGGRLRLWTAPGDSAILVQGKSPHRMCRQGTRNRTPLCTHTQFEDFYETCIGKTPNLY